MRPTARLTNIDAFGARLAVTRILQVFSCSRIIGPSGSALHFRRERRDEKSARDKLQTRFASADNISKTAYVISTKTNIDLLLCCQMIRERSVLCVIYAEHANSRALIIHA